MYLVGNLQLFPTRKIYCMNLYFIDILKLRTHDWLYLVRQKYLSSLWSSSLYCALFKNSNLVGLVKTDFNKYMLNLGLSYQFVQGSIRATQSLFLGFFYKNTINFISYCTLTSIFYWFLYQTAWYIYLLWIMLGLYNCWLCITSFTSGLGKKNTHVLRI